ncbi:MAG TPA: hypothetical protein VK488_03250 [Gaiellaceae bacterium]|nr:hypothetical protein [Gaiellaceae bacterium]
MHRAHFLLREAMFAAGSAASLAALLIWLGPPGNDLAAHVYQRTVFLHNGFQLWNNFWYGGRYSFVTYSVLYYPLAGVLGIKPLAVASIATAALAFAVIVGRQWGPLARWSSRTFGVVWAGLVISAAFPFALGIALGLLSIWALQAGKRWRFGILAVLSAAASPLAFLLLAIFLAGIGLGMRERSRRLLAPTLIVAGIGATQFLLARAFSDGGHYPFSVFELCSILLFCVLGAALTWHVESAGTIRWFFVAYAVTSGAAFLVASPLGENIARVRFAALPIAVLVLSLRSWRPLWVAALALVLAGSWNLSPHAWSFSRATVEPTAHEAFWQPAVAYLSEHLTPSYRVEVVDTSGHWAAVYLPRAGIPLTRGWFRQDDFPQNEVLYDRLDEPTYLRWLRHLGVRYVVLTDAPTDYSSKEEARLIRSGRSGLVRVLRTQHIRIFSVPRPRPLLTGSAPAEVLAFAQSYMLLHVGAPGRYRLAVRYSPYWRVTGACVSRGKDGMVRLTSRRGGLFSLRFKVDAGRALATMVGSDPADCSKPASP